MTYYTKNEDGSIQYSTKTEGMLEKYYPGQTVYSTDKDTVYGYDGALYVSGTEPTPPLQLQKDKRIVEIDRETSRLILAGFDYEIDGQEYHFGYDQEDQGNFTKAVLAATIATTKNQPYAQSWRGWIGDTPYTLTLDAQGMMALGSFAGINHQQALLSSGWALTEQVRNATTQAEIDAVVDDRAPANNE